MELYLAGHLGWYDSQKRKSIQVPLARPTLLIDVLFSLHVPLAEIAVAAVNGHAILSLADAMVTDADKVELFPPVDGGQNLSRPDEWLPS